MSPLENAVAQSLAKQCQRCLSLEGDVTAANRMNDELRAQLRTLRNEIQILTRERDNLIMAVGRGGVDTTGLNQA